MMGHTKTLAGVAVAALLTFTPAHAQNDYAEGQYIETKETEVIVGKVKTHRRGPYASAKQVSSSEEWRKLDLETLAYEAEQAADAAARCTEFIERHQVFGNDCMRAMDLGTEVYEGLVVVGNIRASDEELIDHFGHEAVFDSIIAFDAFGREYMRMSDAVKYHFK